jgi:uncharacterized protein (DUF305 family)
MSQAHDHASPREAGAFPSALQAAMSVMHRTMAAAPLTGDPDQDFLAAMIPHHEGAIEMARLVLVHGRDPLVRRLAEDILASQQAEVTSMRARLAILRRAGGGDTFPLPGGTRGPVRGR